MIIIRMTGGLGNQMFQYALYLKLCSMGREVKFDDITEYEMDNARPVMLWAFDISYPKADRDEINEITDGFMKLSHRIRRRLFGRRSREYHERSCNFDAQALLQETAYLTGYFQSEKYFEDIEKQVREAFVFSNKIWDIADLGLRKKMEGYLAQIEGSLSVSIHVRRGDYLTASQVFGGSCTEEYYQSAVEWIRVNFPQAVFFVFTNDVPWVQEWLLRLAGTLKGACDNHFVVIEGGTEETGYLDMMLMSRCCHHILANSSFSWWGAWLNASKDKKVIAPAKWFNNQECRDIYTRQMTKITPEGELIKA